MKEIIEYLKQTYRPLAIICYGSYADGSNNENSDFDALVIAQDHEKCHDVSCVHGTLLDVFVYPPEEFDGEYDCEAYAQVFDGIIIVDTNGIAEKLRNRAQSWIASKTRKTKEAIAEELAWCRKMLLRAGRRDAEGMFRLHWLLTDSLEIFCDAAGMIYLGPKKSIRRLEKAYPEGFACYEKALADFSVPSAEKWIDWIEALHSGE